MKFSLPGYYRHKDLILFFLQLQQNTPEIFLPNRVIDSAYDFPCLTWNGGREYTVDHPLVERDLIKMQGELEALRSMGLKLRHTCTNSLIEGHYLKDWLCNFYLGNMEKEGDSVIVANNALKDMIRAGVVTGVMSFAEMDAMMYKIEGEDLYLIGTSEHSMIGKFIDQILPEAELPYTLTSYSPCFRKEK